MENKDVLGGYRRILTSAFNRGALAHVLIDFQKLFHRRDTHRAFVGGRELAGVCRPDVPNLWVSFDEPKGRNAFHIAEPQPWEKTFTKHTYSAFSWNALGYFKPRFNSYLRRENIDTLVISGVEADVCVGGTIRHALKEKYVVLPVIDAINFRQQAHAAVRDLYGDHPLLCPVTVNEVREVLGELRQARARGTLKRTA